MTTLNINCLEKNEITTHACTCSTRTPAEYSITHRLDKPFYEKYRKEGSTLCQKLCYWYRRRCQQTILDAKPDKKSLDSSNTCVTMTPPSFSSRVFIPPELTGWITAFSGNNTHEIMILCKNREERNFWEESHFYCQKELIDAYSKSPLFFPVFSEALEQEGLSLLFPIEALEQEGAPFERLSASQCLSFTITDRMRQNIIDRARAIHIPVEDRLNVDLSILLQQIQEKENNTSLVAIFNRLRQHIPTLPTLEAMSLEKKAETIRVWMSKNQDVLNKITRLNLDDLGLLVLPPEIGKFVNLQELHINRNRLRNLPKEMGQLVHLHVLHINDNQLSNLPKEIGQLVHLQELVMCRNQLRTLPKEIGNLVSLTSLVLKDNKLRTLPKEIGQLISLKRLILKDNKLGTLPREIGQLISLEILELRNNQLCSLPREIRGLVRLETLFLRGNHFSCFPDADVIRELFSLALKNLSIEG